MNETLFQITCPSCETTFEVTDPELVGQIVACPKCGGMIMIGAPSDSNASESPGETEKPSSRKEEVESPRAFGESAPPIIEKTPEKDALVDAPSAPPQIEAPPVVAPPMIRSTQIEEQNDAPESSTSSTERSKSAWRARIILMLSGTICALLCFLLIRPFLSYDVEVEEPQEVPPENAVVLTQEEPEAPGELAEEETDVANLVNPNDVATDANDVFGESDAPEIATVDITEETPNESSVESPLATDSSDVETQTAREETEQTDAIENEINSERASSVDEQTSDDAENAEPSETENFDETNQETAQEDELESDEALPTEFDEEEFEKANQASSEESDEQEEDLGAVASTTEVDLQNALPTLAREPKKIDVEERLKLPIRAITFPKSPAATLRLLSEYSGVPFELDLACFESMRSSFNATLDLTLENVDVGGALDAVAQKLKWSVVKEEGKVVVAPAERGDETLIEERFDVSDLLGVKLDAFVEIGADNENASSSTSEETALRLIETLVAPETWESRGGAGRVSFDDGALVVFQDAQNRRCVATLLERLRALRGLESQNASIAETLIPETLGWEKLARKTTLNLLKSVPLQQALEILEHSQKFLVLWDDAALNESGYGRDATIAANFDAEPLERVLFDLLDPLNFSYVILGENLVLITTKEKASNYQTFEICLYSESDERKTLEEAKAISNEMKGAIGAKAWETSDAALWLDLETNCWLIRQSQPIQREIRRWASKRNEKKSGEKKAAPLNEPEDEAFSD